jgi:effector-binding domain-containing protein
MVKKILLGIAGLIVLLIIVGFFLPSKIEITRSISISAPAAYSFEEVNNLTNWEKWSYWHSLDSTMKLSYGEKHSGPGGWYSWESEEMGNGKLTITDVEANKKINADLDFMDQGTAKSWFTFEPDGDGTKLTMGFESDFGYNPFMRWIGATIFPSEMNKAYDYNLAKIKSIAESKPVFRSMITEDTIPSISYVAISHTMSMKDNAAVNASMEKMFTTLFSDMKKAKVAITGHPLCLYPGYSEELIQMLCAVPVAPDAKVPAKYTIASTTAGKAIKTVHTGSYDKLGETHNEMNKYIQYKKMKINGVPMEVYVTDPTVEKDTSKWITEIYYPVE